jgi:hypothetical protein
MNRLSWILAGVAALLVVAGIVRTGHTLTAHAEAIRAHRTSGLAASLAGQASWLAIGAVVVALTAIVTSWLANRARRGTAVLAIVVLTVILPAAALQFGVARSLHNQLLGHQTMDSRLPAPAVLRP